MLTDRHMEPQFVIFVDEPGIFWWAGDSPQPGHYYTNHAERRDGHPQLKCNQLRVAPAALDGTTPESEVSAASEQVSEKRAIWYSKINDRVIAGPFDTAREAMMRAQREALIREWQIGVDGFYPIPPVGHLTPEELTLGPPVQLDI